MRARATIIFTGLFVPEAFAAFVDHRARRLDLAARIAAATATRVAVRVEGDPDLIDAFELACSLGPLDCLVIDVARRDDIADARETADDL